MSLRQPHEEAILSCEEIAMVRQVLADCSQLLERAQRDAGPAVGALLAEATRAATAARRGPDGMIYHINLAIDYLDFAPAARRRP
jgi:hypothetical protein